MPDNNIKGKVLPYSLPSVGPGADPGIQVSILSHPGGRPGPRFTFVSIRQMALPLTEVTNINCSLLLICQPRKDERLSWPGWLTYSYMYTCIGDQRIKGYYDDALYL